MSDFNVAQPKLGTVVLYVSVVTNTVVQLQYTKFVFSDLNIYMIMTVKVKA